MITSGTLLIDKNALCPRFFDLRDGTNPQAWMSVTHSFNPRELAAALSDGGWTFFYMAQAIRKRAFGFDQARMTQAALAGVIASVREQKCNSLEIDRVTSGTWLGLSWVDVSAHARHLQKGSFFTGR
jgi:hypothetical protein